MRRRVLLAGGAASAAFVLFAAPAALGIGAGRSQAQVPVGSDLVSYTGLANAPGIGITGIYMGVSLDIPQVSSSLTTGGVGAGLSSLAWPGDIGGNAGTAILVLEPSAPSWVKILNDPVKAESHSTGTKHSVNKTLPGTLMESNASNTAVNALSRTGLSLPVLGSLGAFTGSSSAKLIGPHTIRAVADSAVTDISLANGLIKIAALKSHAVVVSNGKTSHGSADTTVGGVTIAGVPVTIDSQGIHLAKSVVPTSAITSLLTKTLNTLHLETTFTPTLVSHVGPSVSYDAGALVLSYHPGTSDYSITLGRAAAQVSATPSLLPGVFTPPPTSTGTPSTSSSGGGTSSGGSSIGLPGGTTSTGSGSGQPPSIASQNAASSFPLAGGPTGWMIFGVVAATLIGAFALPGIAGRFLAAPAGAGCEEDE